MTASGQSPADRALVHKLQSIPTEPMGYARLDGDDIARLGMDTRENPMVVTAIVRLDGPLAWDALLELVDTRILLHHERMRVRVVRAGLVHRLPRWREVATSAREHVTRGVLSPDGAFDAALADFVSDVASQRLDPAWSPWRVWLVEREGDGCALVFRIHHVLGDGLALLRLLFELSDEGAGMEAGEAHLSVPAAPHPIPSTDGSALRRAIALAHLLLRRADRPSRLHGTLSGRKRVAWTAPLDVAVLLRAAHAADAHVNDLLLGILAGALRELLKRDGPAPDVVHALVPVALARDGRALGNHFVSLFVPLPVGLASPIARVRAARDAMRRARADSGVPLGRTLVAGASWVGPRAERAAVRVFSGKATLVAANLAGPPVALHLGGRRITDVLFASPAPGSVALSASAFSYANQLRVTIAADTGVISDPGTLVGLIEAHARSAIAPVVSALRRSAPPAREGHRAEEHHPLPPEPSTWWRP